MSEWLHRLTDWKTIIAIVSTILLFFFYCRLEHQVVQEVSLRVSDENIENKAASRISNRVLETNKSDSFIGQAMTGLLDSMEERLSSIEMRIEAAYVMSQDAAIEDPCGMDWAGISYAERIHNPFAICDTGQLVPSDTVLQICNAIAGESFRTNDTISLNAVVIGPLSNSTEHWLGVSFHSNRAEGKEWGAFGLKYAFKCNQGVNRLRIVTPPERGHFSLRLHLLRVHGRKDCTSYYIERPIIVDG